MINDGELLRQYVEEGSEAAFTEVVNRHVHVVHAMAMRRSNSNSHLAADVTQRVLISLARHAPRLIRHPAITGWLFTTTRNAVLDALRSERRRQRYEQEAYTMYDNDDSPQEEPSDKLLLDAVDQLKERDREVLLLRYFQGWQLSQIGATLLLPEDTVRMRVDRAVTKLRAALARRGITSSAGMLATALANNSALGAPADLVGQMTRVALAAGPATSLTFGLGTLFYETKGILSGTSVVLAVLAGAFLYQSDRRNQLQDEISRVLVERTMLRARVAATTRNTPATAGPVASAPAQGPVVTVTSADDIALLRALIAAAPEEQIPELALLGERDWQLVVNSYSPTDKAILPTAFKSLREGARIRFAANSMEALRRYSEANAGALPTQVSQLGPYYDQSISPEILGRYVMLRQGQYADMSLTTPLIGEISGVTVATGDSVVRFGRSLQSIRILNGSAVVVRAFRSVHSFMSTHGGKEPASIDELGGDYSPTERSAVQHELDLLQATTLRLKGSL